MKYAIIIDGVFTEIRDDESSIIPPESITLSDEQYLKLSSRSSTIVDGQVVDIAPVSWSREPLLKRVRAARVYALNAVIGIMTTEIVSATPDQALIDACIVARQSLLDMTHRPAVLSATDDASLMAALIQAYAEISIAAPDAIKNAFAEMNL